MGQRTGRVTVLGAALTACALFLGSAAAWAQGPGIVMSTVTAAPGETIDVTATLATGGEMVAGTQNDFSFDPVNTPVGTRGTTTLRPDCTFNPDINKAATSFAFQPAGCTGMDCVRVRAIVFATDNTDPILDGALLYTCKINVSATAADGSDPLAVSGAILSNPTGQRVCGTGTSDPPCTGNTNGAVNIGPITPGPSNTPTAAGGPTFTPTVSPTGPTRTVTSTATPATVQALLSEDITATATAIPISDVLGFPASGTVKIGSELINYSGIQQVGGGPQGVLQNAQRGVEGTTAAAHTAGSLVQLQAEPFPQDDDDGCSCIIASNGGSSRKAWMVLIPVIGLLVLRRRYR